jgi:hypothetical protein
MQGADMRAAGFVTTGITLLLAGAVTLGQASNGPLPENACGHQWARAGKAFDALGEPYRGHLLARLSRATALFRFQRKPDAIRMLDRTDEKLAGSWVQELPAAKRIEAVEALTAFRTCISSARPPAFGTLTVHVFDEDDARPDGRGEPAAAGVLIRVEGRDVGRTRTDGTLTARVPSGSVDVLGIIPPSDVGLNEGVRVPPAAETTIELILRSGAEPAEDTDLILAEARDDVLLHTATSLTFKFLRDDVFVPMARIEEVALVLDAQGGDFEFLPDELFAVQDGAIVATNVRRVVDMLMSHAVGTVRVRVTALDGEQFVHSADVEFRIR